MASRRGLIGIYEQVLSREGTVSFRDLEALLLALGFVLKAQKGCHRIWLHPAVGRPFPIQPDGSDAKRY